MKLVGITQRVDVVKSYGERRDGLDQEWSRFIVQIGCAPVPLPNIDLLNVKEYLDKLPLSGVIFTGGNDILDYVNTATNPAPERDQFERVLFDYAVENKLPVLAICRGMQFVNYLLGGQHIPINGHIAARHEIITLEQKLTLPKSVNSFHGYGIKLEQLAESLKALALSDGNFVEAYKSTTHNILGLMWHPEREKPFNQLDIDLIKALFND
jgi:putative glutamine amidotransferase